jgi:hypothetical protein
MTDAAIITSKRNFIQEARRVLAFFQNPVWSSSEARTDEEHVNDFAENVVTTRERFPELPEKTEMHMVINDDGDQILALTGFSPEAAERARAICAFLRSMPHILLDMEHAIHLEERVDELLKSNNEKLLENRDQRATIRKLEAQVAFLLNKIPVPVEAS